MARVRQVSKDRLYRRRLREALREPEEEEMPPVFADIHEPVVDPPRPGFLHLGNPFSGNQGSVELYEDEQRTLPDPSGFRF